MLTWYANMRNESITGTRQHFTNILLGFEERAGDVAWLEEWEVPVEKRVVKRREGDVVGSPKGKSPRGSGRGSQKVRKVSGRYS